VSVRALAKEIGISYTSLTRFERGTEVRQWVKIFLWLLGKDGAPRQLTLKPTKQNAQVSN
jgi:transcriptional regulator with XRE-family HTH domain